MMLRSDEKLLSILFIIARWIQSRCSIIRTNGNPENVWPSGYLWGSVRQLMFIIGKQGNFDGSKWWPCWCKSTNWRMKFWRIKCSITLKKTTKNSFNNNNPYVQIPFLKCICSRWNLDPFRQHLFKIS